MNWYKNLKIKNKFIICFGLIILFVFILGTLGVTINNYTNNSYRSAIEINSKIVSKGLDIIDKVTALRVTALNNFTKIDKNTEAGIRNEMKNAYETAINEMNSYLELLDNDKSTDRTQEKQLINQIIEWLSSYYELFDKYIDAILVEDFVGADEIDQELISTGQNFFQAIYKTPTEAFNILSNKMDKVENTTNKRQIIFFIIFLIIQVMVILFAIRMIADIRIPLNNLKDVAGRVSKGDLSVKCRTNNRDELGELSNAIADMSDTFQNILDDINELSNQLDKGNVSYRINSNRYEGAFRSATNSINVATNNLVEDSLYVIDRIKDFGNGEFDIVVKDFPGEKSVIKEGIIAVQSALKSVSKDIFNLIEAANQGNLEFRLNTERYVGQWKETTDGLNQFVENVVIPIKETQNALNQFAKGNFAHRITNEYKGEFNEIKKTVNYTAETIGSYIAEISDILNEMANKNFDVSIDRNYLGDFEQIQKSVNLIVQNLNILTRDIISSAEQVSAGAKQISESSISLAEGATEQAGSVEQLNNTVNIISKQSRDNVKSSEKANELATEARNSANEGSKQMDSMLVAMEEINAASSSISNIIKVIDDIAFQTNILALNAAVEAARAGEHGKGFAVVAEEVRSLAARSQQAAKETTDLIESSVEKVSEGSKIANNTAEALLSIVNQIEEISNLTHSCAMSSKEQERSIEEITDGISQISTVTQNNTATSEESAAASQELASQAEVFYASVSDFKLKDNLDEM